MNRVCAVHNEYCPDGDCRWCVAPEPAADGSWFANYDMLPVGNQVLTIEEMQATIDRAMEKVTLQDNQRLFGIANVDHLGRIVGESAPEQLSRVCGRCGRDTSHREVDTYRGYCYQDAECRAIAARRAADNMSKNRELLARLKAAEQWPPGGVTGDGE